MKDENKTKAQLIDEMAHLRQRVAELEEVGSAQQSAEQALGEWETTFDAMSDWVCLIDPVTRRILRTNRPPEEIVGVPLAEIVGQSCCRLLHGSDQPLPGCPVNESLRTRRRATLDLEAPDVHRWFGITVDPVLDDHGDVAAVVHIARDITQRKRAEESLAQRTQDLALINALNDAVNRGADLQTLIELMSSELKRTLPCNGATLYLLSHDQEYLVIQNLTLHPSTAARIEALIGGTIPEARIRLKEGSLYRRILEDGDAHIINDAETIKRLMAECTEHRMLKKFVGKVYRFLDIHSVISVPLMADGEAIGLLDVSRSEPFSEADADRLKSVAPQLIGCLRRKRLEDARRESEERYRLLFESSPICLWEEDFSDVKRYLENLRSSGVSDFRAYFRKHPEAVRECTSLVKIADVNRTALDLYQAETKAELLGGLDQVFAEESYGVFVEELVSIAEGRTRFDGESSARTLGGERKDIALRWSVAPGFEETLARVVVSDVDITERKRAEEQLRYQANLLERVADAIISTDMDWAVQSWNAAAERMYGWKAEDVLGTPMGEIVNPEYPLDSREAVIQEFTVNGHYEGEVIHHRRDGTPFWLWASVSMLKDEAGNPTGAVSINRDITERKRAEEALRESEERFRYLSEAAFEAIVIHEGGVIIAANDQFFEMFGFQPDELLGREGIALAVAPEARQAMREQIAGGGEGPYESTGLRKGGARFPMEIRARQMKYEGREVRVATAVDITERKRAEELLCTQRDLALALSAAASLGETLPLCLDAAIEVSGMDCGGVYLVEEASGALNLAADKGLSAEFVLAVSHYEADSANARLVMAGNPAYTRYQELGVPLYEAERREGLRAIAVIPVRQEGRVIACINVASHALQEVPTFLRSGLEATAAQMANAIARARAEEEIRRQNKELEALNAVAATLSSSLNLSEILNSALDKVLEILAVEAGGIYLVDETSQRLTLMAHHGVSEEFVSQVGELAVDEETIARATEMGKAGKLILATELLLKDSTLLKAVTTAIAREKLRPYLQVIIRSKGAPAGLLVAASREAREFTAREEQLLSTIAHQIGLAVENVSLYGEQVNKVFQMDALRKTTLEITSQLDLDVLLHSIASRAIQLLNGTAGGLYLYRPEQDVLEWAVAIGDAMAPVGTMLRPGEGLAGKVWETGQSLVVDDYHHWEGRAAVYEAHPLTAVVGAPVRWGATVLGVLCVNALTPRAFSQADANLLSLFASQAAIAIENARLYEGQERRAREMTALYETSLDITGRLALNDVLSSIVNRGVELLHSAGGAVWLYRPGEDELELAVDCGTPKSYVGGRLKVGEGVSGEVFATRQAIAVEDYRQWEGRLRTFESDFIGGMLGVPLMWGEQAIGVLNVNEMEKPRKFTEEEVRLLSLFANQAAVAIQNARLHEETETRRRYLETLQGISSTLRSTLPLSDVLDQIVHGTTEALDYTGAAIALPDHGGERLSLRTVSGGKLVDAALKLAGRSLGSFTLPLTAEDNLIVRAFLTGEFQASSGEPEGLAAGAEPPISPRVARAMEKMMGTKSAVCVPLRSGETTVGVLIAMSPRERLADEERAMLVGLADQGGLAMENARLFEETRRGETQLAALHDVSLEIASELDLTVLLKTVAQRAVELLGAPRGGLYLYRPERQELEMVVNLGWEHDHLGTTLRLGEGACGRAAQTGQPLLVVDYANWEGRSVKFQDEGNFNVLAVPIKHGDSLLGALHINDPDLERRFDEADIRLATMFANQAAIAIENARLHHEQHQRAEELTALHETALDITRHLDLDSLLAAVIARATRLLDAPSGDIYLYRPDLEHLKSVASLGMPPQLQGTALKPGEGLTGKVFETGEPLAVDNYESWDGRSAQYAGYGFSRALGAPLRHGTRSLGVLVVDRPADAPCFTERDANLLTLFANQATIAIENAQLLNAVAKHKENLQELSSRLIDAQEQERKRIAQELHDEMGQALTAMSINLSAINKQLGAALDPETAERLAETDSLITRTLEQMRELALDLRPSMLDDLGLLPALRWYVKRYENRTGILVGLEAVGLELRLPEHIETAMYRVVQEALTNVARHARANRVNIRLQQQGSIVQAFIEDDGLGFDVAEVADREAQERGVGLVGMRERIAAVGGSMEIKSHPGKGTRLAIQLPLP